MNWKQSLVIKEVDESDQTIDGILLDSTGDVMY